MIHNMGLAAIDSVVNYAFSMPPAQAEADPEPLVLLVVVLLSAVGIIAMMILIGALLPDVGRHTQAAVQRSPWRSFFVGLINTIFVFGVVAILSNIGSDLLGLLAALILAAFAFVMTLGLSGVVSLLGHRLSQMQQSDMSPLHQTIWSTLILEFACVLPFIGWFLVTPILMMISFGGAVLAWRNRKQLDMEIMTS